MAELLELDAVRFKKLYEIRWLSLGECLQAIVRNYEALTVTLSQEADAGDPTATGLYQQLTSYKFCALLHLMTDILGSINHLSKIFQYRDVCFSAVKSAVSIENFTLLLNHMDGCQVSQGICLFISLIEFVLHCS